MVIERLALSTTPEAHAVPAVTRLRCVAAERTDIDPELVPACDRLLDACKR